MAEDDGPPKPKPRVLRVPSPVLSDSPDSDDVPRTRQSTHSRHDGRSDSGFAEGRPIVAPRPRRYGHSSTVEWTAEDDPHVYGLCSAELQSAQSHGGEVGTRESALQRESLRLQRLAEQLQVQEKAVQKKEADLRHREQALQKRIATFERWKREEKQHLRERLAELKEREASLQFRVSHYQQPQADLKWQMGLLLVDASPSSEIPNSKERGAFIQQAMTAAFSTTEEEVMKRSEMRLRESPPALHKTSPEIQTKTRYSGFWYRPPKKHTHSSSSEAAGYDRHAAHPAEGVYKQRLLVYTGREDQLLWEECGIKLHFPSHSSQVYIEGTVSVLSRDDDEYTLPEGSELVSAVYRISASQPFPVPVTVQVQHCIPLLNSDEAAQLGMSFLIADTQQGSPYVFRELEGGDFRETPYAEIQLTHFSDIAIRIKWRLGRPIPFSASVHYAGNNKATLVVTQNLAAHITAVKDEFKGATNKCEFYVKTDRHSPAIGLEVPSNSPWRIIPLITPAKIDMDVVLHYKPGKLIPQITLIMKWAEPGQPVESIVPVKLTGVHAPDSFLLQCTPNKTIKAVSLRKIWRKMKPDKRHFTLIKYQVYDEEKEFRLLQVIQHKWYDIGTLLGVPVDTIDSRKTSEEKCQDVLRMWLERDSPQYPVEWDGLMKVLQDVEMRAVAEELSEALEHTHM